MATVMTRLTKAGAILLAKAIAGNTLTFTRGAFGDAAGSAAPSEQQIDNLTALLNEKLSLAIANFKIQNYQAVVTLFVTNVNQKKAFRIAEGGLFARDPESGNEILYSYFYDGDEGAYMPAKSSGVILEYNYELITAVANAANVTAVIDKSTIGLSRAEFEEHLASDNPHPNWSVFNQNGAGLWKNGNTVGLNVASPTQLGGVKIGKNLHMQGEVLYAEGGDVGDDIDARLKQIEINQANLYILLQKNFSLGNQSNLQQVENFDPVSSTDVYEARVYSTPSLKYLRVFDPGSLRVGGHFTVSNNRLLQEQTFIKSFAKWGDYDTPYIAALNAALDSEYPSTLNNYIYRSTVTLRDNKAYGAGEICIYSQPSAKVWKGEGSSDSTQVAFNAFPSLESSLGLDGDWSLTSDGYFALG